MSPPIPSEMKGAGMICPYCKTEFDFGRCVTDSELLEPEPDSVGVCWKCGSLLFIGGPQAKLFTTHDWLERSDDERAELREHYPKLRIHGA